MPEHSLPSQNAGTPWGHKITFYVYVPGSFRDAEMVERDTMFPEPTGSLGFIGSQIEPMATEPRSQEGS